MVVVFRAFPEPYGCAEAVISDNNKNSTNFFFLAIASIFIIIGHT